MDSGGKKNKQATRPVLPKTDAFREAVEQNKLDKNYDVAPRRFKGDEREKALGNEKRLRGAIRNSLAEAKKNEGNEAFKAGFINEARQYHAYLKKYQSMAPDQRDSRRYYPQVEVQKAANSNVRKPDLLKIKKVGDKQTFSFVEFKSKLHDDAQRIDTLSIIGTKGAVYKTFHGDQAKPIGDVKSFKTLFAGKDGTKDAPVPHDPAHDNLTPLGKHSRYTPTGLAPQNARSFTVINKHANERKPDTADIGSFFSAAKVETKAETTPSNLSPFGSTQATHAPPKKSLLSKSLRPTPSDPGKGKTEQKARLSPFEKKSDNPFAKRTPIRRSDSFDEQHEEISNPKKRERSPERDSQPNKKVATIGDTPTVPKKKPILVRSDSDEFRHSSSFGSISPNASPPQSPRNNTNNSNFPALNLRPQNLGSPPKPVTQSLSSLSTGQAKALAPKIKQTTTGVPKKPGPQKRAPSTKTIEKAPQKSKKAKVPEQKKQGTLDAFFGKK